MCLACLVPWHPCRPAASHATPAGMQLGVQYGKLHVSVMFLVRCRYDLGEKIGKGASCTVHVATDQQTGERRVGEESGGCCCPGSCCLL